MRDKYYSLTEKNTTYKQANRTIDRSMPVPRGNGHDNRHQKIRVHVQLTQTLSIDSLSYVLYGVPEKREATRLGRTMAMQTSSTTERMKGLASASIKSYTQIYILET